MTAMLASVRSVAEAAIALAETVDIIDLKEPSNGALGRLDTTIIGDILGMINGRCPVSATIGDLPMQAPLIVETVHAVASTGVDYIKVGFTQDDSSHGVMAELVPLAAQYRLIAVLFADQGNVLAPLAQLKKSGFAGVMLDTCDKGKGALPELLSAAEISLFVRQAKQEGLFCGLAGSLKITDIPDLIALSPDYLGFRSALCPASDRTDTLQADALRQIKQTLTRP